MTEIFEISFALLEEKKIDSFDIQTVEDLLTEGEEAYRTIRARSSIIKA